MAKAIKALHDRKTVNVEFYSSLAKDDCINLQLPGCYLVQDKQGNRFYGTSCKVFSFFFLFFFKAVGMGGGEGGGRVASHALLIKMHYVKRQKNACTSNNYPWGGGIPVYIKLIWG